MAFLTEEMLPLIPFAVCIVVMLLGGGVYALVKWIKKK